MSVADHSIFDGDLFSSPLYIHIQSRRYLGNKFKMLKHLEDIIKERCSGPIHSFCDLFAGTGVVGHYFNQPGRKIISNDLLYSNYVSLYAWLSPEKYNKFKIVELLRHLNNLKPFDENYVSLNFGGRYFSQDNALKIGAIREEIEALSEAEGLNFKEKSILLTSLLYAMDKVANTCGHYDAYRKKLDTFDGLELKVPFISQKKNICNEIFCEDSNRLIRSIKCDLLYIDPPYNSRQYSDTYHLLENVVRWDKPPLFGVGLKMDRKSIKSDYCIKKAPAAFDELITCSQCRYILVSYNNMAEKGDGRSNARISDEDIFKSLSKRGRTEYFEFDYRHFSTGKRSIDNHTERVFFVEVVK